MEKLCIYVIYVSAVIFQMPRREIDNQINFIYDMYIHV
jgi:hypothetical protein